MRAERERRLHERATLGIAVAGLVLAYLAVALPAHWWPFSGPNATPDVRIDTVQSHIDAPGYDDPSKEYICLVNAGGEAVDLAGWQLHDAGGLVNELPRFGLAAHAQVRVHPGPGADSRTDIYGDAGRPSWSNEGGSVTLLDDDGDRVAQASYPAQDSEGAEYASCGPGPRP